MIKFGQKLRSRFWKASVEEEVDAELDFHLEMRAREYIASGMDAAAAREAAVRRFGDMNRVNETCRDIGRRRDQDMRRTEYLSELIQDVTFGCRQLLKNPGFSVVAILTLALGIGATSAIFSAVHAVVLRPLPVPNPDRVVAVYEFWRGNRGSVSAGNFVDGVGAASNLTHATAIRYSSFNLGDAADAERLIGASTTAGFFGVFSTAPALGRVYTPLEDQPGREQVVVLSHRLWTRRFASDPNIVGRQIRLSGRSYEVLGVMPASFDFTQESEELWVPIAWTPERKATHDEHQFQVYGRLKASVTPAQAQAELGRIAQDLRIRFPKDDAELDFAVTPMMEEFVGDYGRRLFILLGAVGFVLLIACGNIANLLLARGAGRAGEMAIRAALGAGRGRMVRQLLTESLVLGLISAAVGLALAASGVRALIAAAPGGVPRLEQTTLDPVVLGFTLLLALVSSLLFGLAPAVRVARSDVHTILKEGGRGAGMGGVRDRLRTALIIGELAIALVLLVGAGLLIRSSLALQRVHPGFEPHGVATARLSLPAAEYPAAARVLQTFERIVEAARRIPGVEAAGVTSQVPMGAGGNGNGLLPEGKLPIPANFIMTRLRIVTPGYLDTMAIPIVRGRGIQDDDRRGGLKIMVISEALAKAAFPGQNPLGKRISCCESEPDGTPGYKTVVGVARDVLSRGPGEAPSPEFYLPASQVPDVAWDWIQRTMYVAVRTPAGPETMALPLRKVVRDVAPGVPMFDIRTMEQRLGASLATARFNTLLLALLGAIGVVLAAVGIYGVMAYFVTRRTREIGVRMALGATRGDVMALVVRQAAWPVVLGIGAGVVVSAVVTRVLVTQLFSVKPHDPLTFAVVAAGLAGVALLASLVPALRAASVDPTKALHTH
jgi:putative ABC transport system permease protein